MTPSGWRIARIVVLMLLTREVIPIPTEDNFFKGERTTEDELPAVPVKTVEGVRESRDESPPVVVSI